MNTLPEHTDVDTSRAEQLSHALYSASPGHLDGAAVTLLCDIPGDVYAQPWFATYLIEPGVDHATVDWPRLAGDLLAGGAGAQLDRGDRALLALAASIGGGGAVHLRALLADLDDKRINLVIGALQRAMGW